MGAGSKISEGKKSLHDELNAENDMVAEQMALLEQGGERGAMNQQDADEPTNVNEADDQNDAEVLSNGGMRASTFQEAVKEKIAENPVLKKEEKKDEDKPEKKIFGFIPVYMAFLLAYIFADVWKNLGSNWATKETVNGTALNVIVSMVSLAIVPVLMIVNKQEGDEAFCAQLLKLDVLLAYCGPAVCFSISQMFNVGVGKYIDAGVSKALQQLRLPIMAFIGRYVLGTGYTPLQWLCLFCITFCVMVFGFLNEKAGHGGAGGNLTVGMIMLVLGSLLSVLGSIFAEKKLKAYKSMAFYIAKWYIEWPTLVISCVLLMFQHFIFGAFDLVLVGTGVDPMSNLMDGQRFDRVKVIFSAVTPSDTSFSYEIGKGKGKFGIATGGYTDGFLYDGTLPAKPQALTGTAMTDEDAGKTKVDQALITQWTQYAASLEAKAKQEAASLDLVKTFSWVVIKKEAQEALEKQHNLAVSAPKYEAFKAANGGAFYDADMPWAESDRDAPATFLLQDAQKMMIPGMSKDDDKANNVIQFAAPSGAPQAWTVNPDADIMTFGAWMEAADTNGVRREPFGFWKIAEKPEDALKREKNKTYKLTEIPKENFFVKPSSAYEMIYGAANGINASVKGASGAIGKKTDIGTPYKRVVEGASSTQMESTLTFVKDGPWRTFAADSDSAKLNKINGLLTGRGPTTVTAELETTNDAFKQRVIAAPAAATAAANNVTPLNGEEMYKLLAGETFEKLSWTDKTTNPSTPVTRTYWVSKAFMKKKDAPTGNNRVRSFVYAYQTDPTAATPSTWKIAVASVKQNYLSDESKKAKAFLAADNEALAAITISNDGKLDAAKEDLVQALFKGKDNGEKIIGEAEAETFECKASGIVGLYRAYEPKMVKFTPEGTTTAISIHKTPGKAAPGTMVKGGQVCTPKTCDPVVAEMVYSQYVHTPVTNKNLPRSWELYSGKPEESITTKAVKDFAEYTALFTGPAGNPEAASKTFEEYYNTATFQTWQAQFFAGMFVAWGLLLFAIGGNMLHSWMGMLIAKNLSSVWKQIGSCCALVVITVIEKVWLGGSRGRADLASKDTLKLICAGAALIVSVMLFTMAPKAPKKEEKGAETAEKKK